MTVTAFAPSADQMLSLFEEVALGLEPYVPCVIKQLTWNGYATEELALAWLDFREAIHARAAMAAGLRDWTDFYDYPEVSGISQAVDLKSAEIDDAFTVLMRGPRGGAR